MANQDAVFTIGADPTGLLGALDKARGAFESATSKMAGSTKKIDEGFKGVGATLNDFHSKVTKAFEFVGAAVAVQALRQVAEALNAAAERAEQMQNLSRVLGATTTEYQGLAATAAEAGVKQETLQRGMMTLSQRMVMARDGSKQAQEQLAKVGITAANLADPAFTAASGLYAVAKSGAAAGDVQTVLGNRAVLLSAAFDKLRGGQAAMGVEAAKVDALNQNEIGTLVRYKESVAVMSMEWKNLEGRVGAYVINAAGPLIRSFEQLFSSISNTIPIVSILKGAFAIIEGVIIALVNDVKALGQIIQALGRLWGDVFGGMGAMMHDALTGNWSALKGDAKTAFSMVETDGMDAFDALANNIKGNIDGFRDSWKAAFAAPGASGPESRTQTGGGGTGGVQHSGKGDAAGLAAMHRVLEDKRALIRKEVAEIDKAMNQEVEIWKTGAKSEYDTKVAYLDRQLAAIKQSARDGEIGPEQEYQQEKVVLQQKYAAQMAYYARLKQLAQGNAVELAKIDAQIEKANQTELATLEKLHEQTTQTITRQWDQVGARMSQTFDRTIKGMLAGTMNFGQVMRQTLDQMLMHFIQVETASLAHHLVVEAAKSQASVASGLIQKAAAQSAGKESIVQSGMAGLKTILNDAYQAASGAYAATVKIPYVGPILAPIAATAAFAAVSVFGSGIASAAGGYDIPSGVSPLTQLHPREMVLPEHLADTVRGLSANGGGGTGDTHYHISAIDSRSLEDALSGDGASGPLANALRGLHRRGDFAT